MPVVLLERLPLPSLRTYTSISVLLLASAMYFAHTSVLDIAHHQNVNKTNLTDGAMGSNEVNLSEGQIFEEAMGNDHIRNISNTTVDHVLDVVEFMFQEPWCIWVLVNMAYCCFILLGRLIQWTVFGQLRVSERQHLKDKFWNFIFYKFIFVFGVVNAQTMEEVVMWGTWFSMLGFLHLLAQLSKDRFEYLSFSPTTPAWTHAKVVTLLFVIEVVCGALMAAAVVVGFHTNINTFCFMAAECLLLSLKILYGLVRYGIHLCDINQEGTWENRSFYVYYTELVFELAVLFVDFAHHIHMLLWGNIFLSMASLVICMQLRFLFHEIQRRIKRHKNYLHVVRRMEAEFPVATTEDLETNNDDCAICWDKMTSARKLPCGHLFHNACLRSWLEQDTSCPTCRMSLGDRQEQQARPVPPMAGGDQPPTPQEMQRPINTTNHFFHFDGSRYVSWLPSFSVEVTHTQMLGNSPRRQPVQTSQLDNMARQVLDLFPNYPMNTIVEDLRTTRSVELTIDNILEGRITVDNLLDGRLTVNVAGTTSTEVSTDSDSGESQGSAEQPAHEQQIEVTATGPQGDGPTPSTSAEPATGDSREQLNQPPQLERGDADANESDSSNELPSVSGYRFSKSSSEREAMLNSRKQEMFMNARRRFLAKGSSSAEEQPGLAEQAPRPAVNGSPESSSQDEVHRRRELAFLAAQRRMNQQL